MSIKSELKESYQSKKREKEKNKSENGKKLEDAAKKFIEEFIEPKFREMHKENPDKATLVITFYDTCGGFYYRTNEAAWEKQIISPYELAVVSKAVEFSKDYDINASEGGEFGVSRNLIFSVKLDE